MVMDCKESIIWVDLSFCSFFLIAQHGIYYISPDKSQGFTGFKYITLTP